MIVQILVLFLVAGLGYAFLRSQGGKGLNISVKTDPISTTSGKLSRITAGLLLILIIFVLVRTSGPNHGDRLFNIFTVIAGVVVAIASYFIRKTRQR